MNETSFRYNFFQSFLDKKLKKYDGVDFATKQKVRIFYPICIAGIISLLFLIGTSVFIQFSNNLQSLYLPVLVAEVTLLIIFITCIRLLIKGFFDISSHLFIFSANVCGWFAMFLSRGSIITSTDTIVLILAVINIIPLFISKNHWTIFVYIIANIIVLIIFTFRIKNQFNLESAEIIDFITDVSIALFFIGISGYQLLKINDRILNKVESDYNKRLNAENKLAENELKYTSIFENAQIGIYQTTPEGAILQANPAMLKLQGLKSFDEVAHKNIEEVDVFISKNRDEFREKIEKDGYVKDFESTWVKRNGEFIIVRENARAIRNEKGETLYYEGFIVNITKRKLAEKALKESELKYSELFNNAQIGIFQTMPSGEIIKANPALVKMLGYESVKELVGLNLLKNNFFVNKDRSDFESLMQKQGYVKDFESEWRKKNGEIITIKENSRTVSDDKGNRLFLEGFIENITERKKIERALKENEEKYRLLMENMNDIVMLVDNNDVVLFVNKRFSEKLGYSESEIIGKIGYEILIDPEDREKIIEANRRRKSNISNQYEARFIAKDGTKFDFLISGAPVKDPEGNVIGSIGNMIDITERKVAEEKLKKSQQLFQTLAHTSPVGIFRTRADGYITYVNPKWMEISGLQFEEALGNGWLKAVHPDDKKNLQINWELKSAKGEDSSMEYRFIKPDGSVVWVLGNAVPEIVDDKIQGYIGTVTDITEKKKIEEELAKYREHLEFLVKERTEELETTNEELSSTNEELHSQREELQITLKNLQNAQKQLIQAEKMASLGVLASGVAHEINNPLNFIRGGAFGLEDYLQENLTDHLDHVQIFIDSINEGVERAATIVTSLNHYSHKDESKITECNIHDIIDNCLNILGNQIRDIISIEKNYTNKNFLLKCNEGKMHQAILNIITNALQSIEGKGDIKIRTKARNKQLQIQITDNGCGISEENLSKIFDPFFTTKDPGKGTGLGLSITYNIIEEHNGNIKINSELYSGTTVTITLPIISK